MKVCVVVVGNWFLCLLSCLHTAPKEARSTGDLPECTRVYTVNTEVSRSTMNRLFAPLVFTFTTVNVS